MTAGRMVTTDTYVGDRTIAVSTDRIYISGWQWTAGGSEDSVKANVAPDASLRATQRRPRWLSMIERHSDSPMPSPSFLVEKKAS